MATTFGFFAFGALTMRYISAALETMSDVVHLPSQGRHGTYIVPLVGCWDVSCRSPSDGLDPLPFSARENLPFAYCLSGQQRFFLLSFMLGSLFLPGFIECVYLMYYVSPLSGSAPLDSVLECAFIFASSLVGLVGLFISQCLSPCSVPRITT